MNFLLRLLKQVKQPFPFDRVKLAEVLPPLRGVHCCHLLCKINEAGIDIVNGTHLNSLRRVQAQVPRPAFHHPDKRQPCLDHRAVINQRLRPGWPGP